MIEQLITGFVMGIGALWVLHPFGSYILPHRKWIDLGLLIGLIYLIIMVRSNYVTGLTTYAGFTISAGLRIWHFFSRSKT